jgi:hypothetical protein
MNRAESLPALSRKLAQYCLHPRGVVIAAATLTPATKGAIIYTDVPDITLAFADPNPNPGGATDIFVDFGNAFQPGNATYGIATAGIPLETEFRLSFNNAADKPYVKGPLLGNGGPTFIANTGIEASGPFGPIGGRYASKLALGTPVETQNFTRPANDDSVSYLRTPTVADSPWALGDTGYIGVQVSISGVTSYGWAQISMGLDSTVTLLDFAYNDTENGSILAGQVPEPHGALLLALGASGVATMRRRRG